jgi:hypothetical protein
MRAQTTYELPGKGSYPLRAGHHERQSVSYKSREKKRKYKAAAAKAETEQRRHRHPDRWYLTIVNRSGVCNDPSCGAPLREGRECVFRFSPKEILCLRCAERRKIHYRPSLRWEQANRRRRRSR